MSVGYGALYEDDDKTRIYTTFHILVGSSFVAYILSKVIDVTLQNKKAWYDDDDNSEDVLSFRGKLDKFWAQYNLTIKIGLGFIVYCALGVCYGLSEDFSFIQAVYFAVSSLSTAGLQAPPIGDDRKENTAIFFLGLWILIGIPFYSAVLGAVAGEIIGEGSQQREMQRVRKATSAREFKSALKFSVEVTARDRERISGHMFKVKERIHQLENKSNEDVVLDHEIEFLESMLCSKDIIDWPAYLKMSLLRLGKVDRDTLRGIRESFERIDANGDGGFDKFELYAELIAEKMDFDQDGTLEAREFLHFAQKLYKSKEDLQKRNTNGLGSQIMRSLNIVDVPDDGVAHFQSNIFYNDVKSRIEFLFDTVANDAGQITRQGLLAAMHVIGDKLDTLGDKNDNASEIAFRLLVAAIGEEGSPARDKFTKTFNQSKKKCMAHRRLSSYAKSAKIFREQLLKNKAEGVTESADIKEAKEVAGSGQVAAGGTTQKGSRAE